MVNCLGVLVMILKFCLSSLGFMFGVFSVVMMLLCSLVLMLVGRFFGVVMVC